MPHHGRLGGLAIADCGRYVPTGFRGRRRRAASRILRYPDAALRGDDLKAYYLEAPPRVRQAVEGRQLGDWLWNGTAAGAAIIALRAIGLASEDDRLRLSSAISWCRGPCGDAR